jgi:drug/metabolite transporter (DMT)-like permease
MQYAVLAAFGAFQIGIPYLLFAYGLKHVGGQEAAGLALLEPVLMPLWVLLAWGEEPSKSTIVGAAFILSSLVLRYARPARDVPPA